MLFWIRNDGVLKVGPGKYARYGDKFDESVVDRDTLKEFKENGYVSDINPNDIKPAPKKDKKKGK